MYYKGKFGKVFCGSSTKRALIVGSSAVMSVAQSLNDDFCSFTT